MRIVQLLLLFLFSVLTFFSVVDSAHAAAARCTPQTKGILQRNVDNASQCADTQCYEPLPPGALNPNPAACYLLRKPTPAEAAITAQAFTTSSPTTLKYKDATLTIVHSPANPTFDTPQLVINVTADKEIFLPGTPYSSYIVPDKKVAVTCSHTGRAQVVDAKTIKMTVSIAKNYCNLAPGPWKATLYFGDQHRYTDIPAEKKIVTNYPFAVATRDSLQISPLKTPLASNEKPTVILTNAVKDRHYTFWWEGQTTKAGDRKATEDGHFQLELDPKGLEQQIGRDHTLCASAAPPVGMIVTNLTCEARTTFKFSDTPVSTTPNSCSVDPSIIDTNTIPVIKALNVDKNQTFRADLVTQTENKHLPERIQSGASGNVTISIGKQVVGKYSYNVYKDVDNSLVCTGSFEVKTPEDAAAARTKNLLAKKECTGEAPKDTVCFNGEWVAASKAAGDFESCGSVAGGANARIRTAIGCVPINLNSFINALLAWTAGIAGGLAFLLMIFGSLQMITSQGNAEQLKKGREQFIAAISGLLFIIFSITLLQIIGADILGIFPR